MGLTVFVLLVFIAMIIGAGTTATVVLFKNTMRDAMKVGQIMETQVHES